MKKELGIFILLVVLCIIVSILNPRFLAGANLQNMARLIGAYGIFSIGIGIVIITGGIDLSVGSVVLAAIRYKLSEPVSVTTGISSFDARSEEPGGPAESLHALNVNVTRARAMMACVVACMSSSGGLSSAT